MFHSHGEYGDYGTEWDEQGRFHGIRYWREEKVVVLEESLTGVRAESQRGLEAPGVEIRGSSRQDKRHRQRNKHDPSSCLVLIRCSFCF